MTVGDFSVIALNDGVVAYRTADLLPTADTGRIASSLHQAGLSEPWGMSYNAYLIDTGERLILIDTGTGGKLIPVLQARVDHAHQPAVDPPNDIPHTPSWSSASFPLSMLAGPPIPSSLPESISAS